MKNEARAPKYADSISKLAKELERPKSTVSNYTKMTWFPPKGKTGWDVEACRKAVEEHASLNAKSSEGYRRARDDYWRARARRESIAADLAENSVIPLDAARRTFVRFGTMIKARILAVPTSAAVLIRDGMTVNEREQIIRDKITDALREISTHEWTEDAK